MFVLSTRHFTRTDTVKQEAVVHAETINFLKKSAKLLKNDSSYAMHDDHYFSLPFDFVKKLLYHR